MEAIDQAIAMPADNSPVQRLDSMGPPRQSMLTVEPARDILPPFIPTAALSIMRTNQIVEYRNLVAAAQLDTMNHTHQPLVKCDLSAEIIEIDAKICFRNCGDKPSVGY